SGRPELALDRCAFLIQCEPCRPIRVGSEEEDDASPAGPGGIPEPEPLGAIDRAVISIVPVLGSARTSRYSWRCSIHTWRGEQTDHITIRICDGASPTSPGTSVFALVSPTPRNPITSVTVIQQPGDPRQDLRWASRTSSGTSVFALVSPTPRNPIT